MDMLESGNYKQAAHANGKESNMTATEYKTEFSMWAKKVFETDSGKFLIAPRYTFEDDTATVVLGYEKNDTSVFLSASQDAQDVKVTHKIDDDNTASIKFGAQNFPIGFQSATLENESGFGTTKVTLTSESADIELGKDGWVAGLTATSLDSEPVVRFSKKIAFSANI